MTRVAPEAPRAQRGGHMPGLDGLRGILIFGIMAYHLGLADHMFITVDSFFVLSGFLITGLLLRRTPSTAGDLRAWWGRRARRLVPAAALMVAVVVAVFAAVPGVARDGFATMTWWANWNQAFGGTDYWSPEPSPLRHAWSLSIEEQFYLVWPVVLTLVVALARRLRVAPAVAIGSCAAVLATTSFVWSAHLADSGISLNRIYLGTDTRAGALLLGCAAATLPFLRRTTGSRRSAPWLTALGVAGALVVLVLGLTLQIDAPATYRGGLALAALGSVALVAAASRPGPVASALTLGPLVWLGVRSYGIYLWSWPAQLVIEETWPTASRTTVVVATVVVSFALGALSLRLVEAPLRSRTAWAGRPAPRRFAWSLGAAVVAVAILAVGLTAEPLPEYQTISVEESAQMALADARTARPAAAPTTVSEPATTAPAPSTSDAPSTSTAPAPTRAPSTAPAPPAVPPSTTEMPRLRVITAGDSQAFNAAVPKIPRNDLPPYIESVTVAGVLGCGILVRAPEWTMFDPERGGDVEGDYCLDTAEVAEVAALEARPDWMVLFSGGFERPFGYKDRSGRLVPARHPELRAAVVTHLVQRIERARAQGVRTALVEWACMGEEVGDTEKAGWTRWHNELLGEVAASIPGTTVIEPNEQVCVGADPTGSPTPEKERAWGHEVHPVDLEWLWNVQLGPELLAASTQP